MSEWKEMTVGEACLRCYSGGTPLTSNASYYLNGSIPWLKTKEINQSRIFKTENFITELALNESSVKWVPVNAITIAMYGDGNTAGRVGLVKIPLTTNQACCNLILNESYANPEFVFYYLQNSYEDLVARKIGSGQQNLNSRLIRALSIVLPPLPEQKAIAGVLSSLDEKIDLLHRQNKTLEAMAKTLFRQWFIEEAQPDWAEVELGRFVNLNQSSIKSDFQCDFIQYLDTGSITENRIEKLEYISIKDAPSRAKRRVKHNDILLSTVRPNLKHYGILKNPSQNLIVSTGFCTITCVKIDPHFVYMLLTKDDVTEYLHSIAEGSTSTYPSLKPSDIANITFQFPPAILIEKFGETAENIWSKINKNQTQIQTLEKLRDTLLPKLMSGEIRVAL